MFNHKYGFNDGQFYSFWSDLLLNVIGGHVS